MLTNLLSVIRGVQCKGVCIVELGHRLPQCDCCRVPCNSLRMCFPIGELLCDDCLADIPYVDDADLILEPLEDADSLYLGEVQL